MSRLRQQNTPYIIPCRNTDHVVKALEEYENKRRGTASKNVIENQDDSVPYDMIITKRKKVKKPKSASEQYIGFATNSPTQDVRVCCKVGNRDRVPADPGNEAQNQDHGYCRQDVLLLLFPDNVQRMDDPTVAVL